MSTVTAPQNPEQIHSISGEKSRVFKRGTVLFTAQLQIRPGHFDFAHDGAFAFLFPGTHHIHLAVDVLADGLHDVVVDDPPGQAGLLPLQGKRDQKRPFPRSGFPGQV